MNRAEENRRELGKKIKLARLQANLNQRQLAKRLGRTGASIAYLEQGKRAISTDILSEIADATGKPITFFFGHNETIVQNQEQLSKLSEQVDIIKGLLEKTEDKYRSLMDQSPDFVFVTRIDNYKFVDVNQRACDYYGYSREEFLSMNAYDVQIRKEVKAEANKLFRTNPVGKVLEVEGVHRRKDGTTFPVQIRFTKINDEFSLANVREVTL